LAVATAAPQFRAISEVVNSQTGEVIPVDENNQDIAGCLVGSIALYYISLLIGFGKYR